VRLDGWAFHALTKRLELERPFDRRLADALAKAAHALFASFNPTLCYIFSDELNFLFLGPTVLQRIEKIDSVFAGLLSAHFSTLVRTPAAFDCRVIPVGRDNVLPYLVWRQAECWRNHNNAWAQWTIVEKEGLNPRSVNRRLAGLGAPDLAKLCEGYGVDLGRTPVWQRRGVLLYAEAYRKQGYDPIAARGVTVERRRLKTDWAVRRFDSKDGEAFLGTLLRVADPAGRAAARTAGGPCGGRRGRAPRGFSPSQCRHLLWDAAEFMPSRRLLAGRGDHAPLAATMSHSAGG
jgi:tRNA(His) 5'-end guanylyltransferase